MGHIRHLPSGGFLSGSLVKKRMSERYRLDSGLVELKLRMRYKKYKEREMMVIRHGLVVVKNGPVTMSEDRLEIPIKNEENLDKDGIPVSLVILTFSLVW